MNDQWDRITLLVSRAINILFIFHPRRTALGVILGMALYSIAKVYGKLAILNWYEFVFIGLLLTHLKTFYHDLTSSELPEDIKSALEMINQAEKSGINKKQIRELRLELCKKMLERVALNSKTREEMKAVEKVLESEGSEK